MTTQQLIRQAALAGDTFHAVHGFGGGFRQRMRSWRADLDRLPPRRRLATIRKMFAAWSAAAGVDRIGVHVLSEVTR